jgi:hypothetical protein
MAKASKKDEVIDIQEIHTSTARFNIIGTSPMIMNRFSRKAWQELLFPSERRSRATLDQTMKHDPLSEYRGALYKNRDDKRPALIHVPAGAFHGALSSAALDVPGAAKAKIERLVKISDVQVDLFGVPQLFMAMVRNSDMNRTPDVRTRPIFPEWACTVTFKYPRLVLTERTITHLFGAAGLFIGIGDWRGQKGGSYGAFKIADDNDATFNRIVKQQGRKAQLNAFDSPVYYDEDTEELMVWFESEVLRREKDLPSSAAKKMPKTKKIFEVDGDRLINGGDAR